MRSVSLMPSETCNNCAIYAESQRKRSRETRSPKGLFLHQQIPGERTPRPTPSQWYWYHSCDSSRWFRLSRWSYCAAGAEGAEAVSSLSSLSLLLGLDSPVTAAAWSQLQGPVCVLFSCKQIQKSKETSTCFREASVLTVKCLPRNSLNN